MKRSDIQSTGVSGVNIALTNVELVAIKGFVTMLKGADVTNKYEFMRTVQPLVEGMIVLLEKILPEEVIGIEEAYKELFTLPTIVEPTPNEL